MSVCFSVFVCSMCSFFLSDVGALAVVERTSTTAASTGATETTPIPTTQTKPTTATTPSTTETTPIPTMQTTPTTATTPSATKTPTPLFWSRRLRR